MRPWAKQAGSHESPIGDAFGAQVIESLQPQRDAKRGRAPEEITHKGCYHCRAARQPRANRQQALPVFIGTAPPLVINPTSKGGNLSVRKWCFVCTVRGVRLEAALVPPCPTSGGSGPFVEALGYGAR